MVSPFRLKKKERRRWRKAARSIVSNIAELEDTNPEVAVSVRRASELYTKISSSKRRKTGLKVQPKI
jgi:hypothetical protein